jgi:alkylation response protein AidB-like acyl-CoA dehydrogenase
VDNVFVPERRLCARVAPPVWPGTLFKGVNRAWSSAAVAAVALGIARDALESFKALARTKQRGPASTLADEQMAQFAVGRAEVRLAAARSLLYARLAENWAALLSDGRMVAGEPLSMFMASVHAAETALEVVMALHAAAGSSAVLESSRLNRCLRNIQVSAQHVAVSPRVLIEAGRSLLAQP